MEVVATHPTVRLALLIDQRLNIAHPGIHRRRQMAEMDQHLNCRCCIDAACSHHLQEADCQYGRQGLSRQNLKGCHCLTEPLLGVSQPCPSEQADSTQSPILVIAITERSKVIKHPVQSVWICTCSFENLITFRWRKAAYSEWSTAVTDG